MQVILQLDPKRCILNTSFNKAKVEAHDATTY